MTAASSSAVATGRKDYTGERNHFASLSLLDDLPALAGRVNAVLGSEVQP